MSAAAASAKEILARLVSFDTVSRNSNLDLIAYVKGYLEGHGLTCHLVPNETGDKTSLFATIGPEDVPGVGLSGHTDVVPVDGQNWDTDPFELVEKDGKLYGRGACDMKGYLACVMAAVPDFKRRQLKVPVHIVFSYDEEVGCTGVRPMIAEMGDRLQKPRMVFVGEPSNMTVVDAHKGPVRYIVDIKGRAAHSSMAHLGANAITAAGRMLGELDRMEQELKALPPNPRFDPPYSTLQVTQIEGGTASNIVPAPCTFGWEIRALPGVDIYAMRDRLQTFADKHCLPDLRAVAPEAEITVTIKGHVPGFAAKTDLEVVSLALKLAGQNETFAVSYATEASLFHEARVPTVICGPGDIAQAHTPNEFLVSSEIDKCLGFFERLGDWCEAQ